LNYLYLAAQRIRVSDARFDRFRKPLKAEIDFNPFNYASSEGERGGYEV
jgi:hypothetical protein